MPRLAPVRPPALPLALALMLAACGAMPDLRGIPLAPLPPAAAAGPMAPGAAPPGDRAVPAAATAEAACQAAARERGFEVQGIVGSADVIGADGRATSRDVMLRVVRRAQVVDLRCNYSYAAAQARIMTL